VQCDRQFCHAVSTAATHCGVLRSVPLADPDATVLQRALSALLGELIHGSAADAAWILNPGDPGLLRSLEKLSAARASAMPPNGGSSIAAHVDHLRYGLQLLNRWSKGEDPFADADYAASWRLEARSETEWAALLNDLRAEAHTWCEIAKERRDLNDVELTGVLASIAHLAYHLGAIRQIDRSTGGPLASKT
jgi:hypothetical protein